MKMNDLAAVLAQTPGTLNIRLHPGTGEGPTPHAAFDAALIDAGVAVCVRLRESSLIPPGCKVVRAQGHTVSLADRHRWVVVMSQMQQSRPGQHAHAGIGWMQRADDGSGLFIDLHDEVRDRLLHDLHAAFGAIRSFRVATHGSVQTLLASRRCEGLPVCAIVIAACAHELW
jgi:pyruvoyl-dependent arginine decarboxylase (PvlArgDC)